MKKNNRNTLILISAILVVIIGLIGYLRLSNNAEGQLDDSKGDGDLRVSLSEAKTAFDTGEALFIDVRNEEQFLTSRIPGAILIPLDDIQGNEPDVAKDALIFTYCT